MAQTLVHPASAANRATCFRENGHCRFLGNDAGRTGSSSRSFAYPLHLQGPRGSRHSKCKRSTSVRRGGLSLRRECQQYPVAFASGLSVGVARQASSLSLAAAAALYVIVLQKFSSEEVQARSKQKEQKEVPRSPFQDESIIGAILALGRRICNFGSPSNDILERLQRPELTPNSSSQDHYEGHRDDRRSVGASNSSSSLLFGASSLPVLAFMSTSLSIFPGVAKETLAPIVTSLRGNQAFMSALVAWALAQVLKVFTCYWVEKRWNWKMLVGSGGMPSSHSALCMGLTTSVLFTHGCGDALFPVCLGFSSIVMYDAAGVRRHAGKQAEVLNYIIKDTFVEGHPMSATKLKELLGHTPSQVACGACLGAAVATLIHHLAK